MTKDDIIKLIELIGFISNKGNTLWYMITDNNQYLISYIEDLQFSLTDYKQNEQLYMKGRNNFEDFTEKEHNEIYYYIKNLFIVKYRINIINEIL